jgi:queuine tRNA-ribosyltransferase
MDYLSSSIVRGQTMKFPTFFPDATRGVIRTIDSQDLAEAGIEGLIVNTYHLMSQPGQGFLKKYGGIKKFMNWPGFIVSDSGGFQLLSMIYKNKNLGTVTDNGINFKVGSTGDKKGLKFTPEKCIEMQFNLNADIIVSLDDCPRPGPTTGENQLSVERTIRWARRCKEEFQRLLEVYRISLTERPLLMGIIQGASDKNLRSYCAEELLKIGFDIYGFGGWPLDEGGEINLEMLEYTSRLIPSDKPKYALGVGNPQAVVDCTRLGYHIFDCVLPTRDGRHRRLYVFGKDPTKTDIFKEKNIHQSVHIMEQKYARDSSPISPYCDCHTCRNYSKAYLQHLFKIGDSLAERLATIHNLRHYTRLIELLRKSII